MDPEMWLGIASSPYPKMMADAKQFKYDIDSILHSLKKAKSMINKSYIIHIDNDFLSTYKLKNFKLITFTKVRNIASAKSFLNLDQANNISKLLRYRLKNYNVYVDQI